jgi:hypothetical protein
MTLQAAHQGRAHHPVVVGVLTVGLLRTAPRRVTQDFDAGGTHDIGALGPRLSAHGVTHPLLQLRIEGGRPRHGDREAGGGSHRDATGPVGEPATLDAKAGDRTTGEGLRRALGRHLEKSEPEVAFA